jgi:hypothetical protein
MARQTRKIADFDDKVLGLSLRKLDVVVGVAIAAFVLAAIIQALVLYAAALSPYLILREVHSHLGRFALFVATLMFGLALYVGLARHADVTPYFRRGTYICFGMMLLEAAIGAMLYVVIGVRPGQDVHLIYGAGTVLSLPFFIYVETTAPKRPAMGSYMWGFALLAGIIIRCLSTGGIG